MFSVNRLTSQPKNRLNESVIDRPRPRRSYTFRVKENARDALVANLSELDFGQGKGEVVSDVLILNNEAKEKFTVTDKGLLYTKV